MPRTNAPRNLVASRLSIGALLAAASLVACGGLAAKSSTSTPSAKQVPSLHLEVTGGPGAGTYTSDPASTLNLCTENAGGGWRAMYAGGDPWISLDLSLGSQIDQPGHASDAALEISAGPGYLWIDQGGFRGGDAKGRSTINVQVQPGPGATTFLVDARTPNRSDGVDGDPSDIALTWTCPS